MGLTACWLIIPRGRILTIILQIKFWFREDKWCARVTELVSGIWTQVCLIPKRRHFIPYRSYSRSFPKYKNIHLPSDHHEPTGNTQPSRISFLSSKQCSIWLCQCTSLTCTVKNPHSTHTPVIITLDSLLRVSTSNSSGLLDGNVSHLAAHTKVLGNSPKAFRTWPMAFSH